MKTIAACRQQNSLFEGVYVCATVPSKAIGAIVCMYLDASPTQQDGVCAGWGSGGGGGVRGRRHPRKKDFCLTGGGLLLCFSASLLRCFSLGDPLAAVPGGATL